MKKTVVIILAEGFEEIEAVTPIDVLRRAGLEVIVAGVGGKDITGAHGIKISADVALEDYTAVPDAVVLPGGLPGADNLKKSKAVQELLRRVKDHQNLIGAICASPARVLAPLGFLDGKQATCYPGFEKELGPKVTFLTDRVVKDGEVITSRGPGTALWFSIALAQELVGKLPAENLAEGLLLKQ